MTDPTLLFRSDPPTLTARLARLRDASLRTLLRSPLRRVAGSGLMLVTYRGRRSGRVYTTPVEFVRDGDRLLVLVAHPEHKQWWRNVAADPAVQVRLGGRDRMARATVESGAEEAADDLAAYTAARPRSTRVAATGNRVVVVRLDLDSDVAPGTAA